MPNNKLRYLRNLFHPGVDQPLVLPGLFQAGSTKAIKRGEILERTADSSSRWVPVDSDFAMSGNIAIAGEEIKAGDLAGYYRIIVPRPGDVFEFELASAGALALGAALYYSSSEKVTTSGTNIMGRVADFNQYPPYQNHKDSGGGDNGETLVSKGYVGMVFEPHVSFWRTLEKLFPQSAHIADASVAHAVETGSFGDGDVDTALDAIGTKLNAALLALEKAGILASS